ncbi:MAG TPA: hypothetical protein VM737_05425 [Gemmatimonadota bacterium]|nr:hypothetical protein [Gemmatimonadota bacterium]
MKALLRILLGVSLLQPIGVGSAAGQKVPPGTARAPELFGDETLLEWLGLVPGEMLAFIDGRGERVCVRVGEPVRLGGRAWVPLQALPWPGLPTDSQVLLPLDGSLMLGVIRTPGPRPHVEPLIPGPLAGPDAGPDSLPFLADAGPVWTGRVHLSDGWHAIGGSPESPEALLYTWCSHCMDARTKVLFERGRGIAFVESLTIAGSEVLMRGDGTCAAPERNP